MSVTVAQIVLEAKQKADMENSNFVKPEEWIRYVNNGYKELYDILVSKFEDYYTVGPVALTVAQGASSVALPADFYKLRGVDRSNGGNDFFAILPFNFNDRNRRGYYQRWRGIEPSIRYRIMGNNLIFTPQDQAAGNYQIYYVPRAADLTSDTDTIDGVNGWEEYVINSAAEEALIKEESDTSAVAGAKAALLGRIQAMAANRDAGQVETVSDVTRAGFYDDLFF